jgi:hypothetical protein
MKYSIQSSLLIITAIAGLTACHKEKKRKKNQLLK